MAKQKILLCEDEDHPVTMHHHATNTKPKDTRWLEHTYQNVACERRDDPIYTKNDKILTKN